MREVAPPRPPTSHASKHRRPAKPASAWGGRTRPHREGLRPVMLLGWRVASHASKDGEPAAVLSRCALVRLLNRVVGAHPDQAGPCVGSAQQAALLLGPFGQSCF